MTPKNLFLAVLKVLGIFFIKDIVEAIPQAFSGFLFLNGPSADGTIGLFIYGILILAVYVVVSYLLIFKSEKIIHWLKLDHGFDQELFSFNLSLHAILLIALIVTGLFLIIIEVPSLFQQVYVYLRISQLSTSGINQGFSSIIYSSVKILIGLMLIGERKRMARFILSGQAQT